MVWTIAKKEFHDNLLTFRFSFGTLILILLVLAITLVNVKNFTELRKNYQLSLQETEKSLKETRVYCQLRYTALKPPEIFSVLNLGVTKRLGNSVRITLREVPSIAKKFTEENPLLSVFPSLDLTLVYKIVISLLALLFGFDAICGEKEKGTLKIILSQKVSRFKVVFGKYLGRLLTLTTVLLISLIVGFVILVAQFASLSLMDWLRLVLFAAFTLLYISIFLILGFLVSALTKKGSSSLLFSLVVWVALVIILPNLTTYLAAALKPIPPEKTVDVQADEISNQTDKTIGAWQAAHPQDIAMSGMIGPDEWAITSAPRNTIYYFRRFILFSEPLLRKKADDIWNVKQDYYRSLKRQEKLSSFLAEWLPTGLFDEATELVSKTNLANYEKFIQQAILYRESIFQYLQSKDAYNSLRYFTVVEEKDLLSDEQWMKISMQKPDGSYRTVMDSPPLQLDDFPRFKYQQESLPDLLSRALAFLLAFILFNLGLFICSAIAFNFYDVR